MDIFQLFGDLLHLVAIIMLILKIKTNRNVLGLSYKTQQLYLVVFLTRYIDLLLGWKSFYLFFMKVIFISLTAYTIFLIRIKKPYSISYDQNLDKFPHYVLYIGAFMLAIIIHKSINPIDFLWSFSVWLQSIAIIPQLLMITKLGQIQNITAHYVLFLGLYRILYIPNWIFHWHNVVTASFLAGIVQSIFYADFIYYFLKTNQNQRYLKFPV